ncbi:hypothetical protein [uncultured Dialister sp.]|uniref:hypothetical protein n=1 Tax=uncultured Dialister sp. TaxID=278064 RepID=UPI0026DA7C76|nr:hypothetical protein [uncultured Dialister sp.]
MSRLTLEITVSCAVSLTDASTMYSVPPIGISEVQLLFIFEFTIIASLPAGKAPAAAQTAADT